MARRKPIGDVFKATSKKKKGPDKKPKLHNKKLGEFTSTLRTLGIIVKTEKEAKKIFEMLCKIRKEKGISFELAAKELLKKLKN